jgi:osmoprotectant transport system permease protein
MSAASIVRLAVAAALLAFLAAPESFAPIFAPLTRDGAPPIYVASSLADLTVSHLAIVFAATSAATLAAVAAAIFVTRPAGAAFLPLSRAVVNVGQTFPPVAVLALAVPALGFGAAPTLVALFLYGLLPIFENTVTALQNPPPAVIEAARGLGMTPGQRLRRVELPLATPVMLAGVRLSAVISLATATIGSTIGAKTLGEVIVSGLLSNNTAFVLQGGLIVAALAVLLYDALSALERALSRRMGLRGARHTEG